MEKYDNFDEYKESLIDGIMVMKYLNHTWAWKGYCHPTGLIPEVDPTYYVGINMYKQMTFNKDIDKCNEIAKNDQYLDNWPEENDYSFIKSTSVYWETVDDAIRWYKKKESVNWKERIENARI